MLVEMGRRNNKEENREILKEKNLKKICPVTTILLLIVLLLLLAFTDKVYSRHQVQHLAMGRFSVCPESLHMIPAYSGTAHGQNHDIG